MSELDLEIIPSSLSPSDDCEEVAIQGRQRVSLDCIRDNRGSWNLIVCEKRAGGVIQSGCTKVGRIILIDGSSGRLRKEKVTNIRVGDAQEINRLNGKRIWILQWQCKCYAGRVNIKKGCEMGSAGKSEVCSKHLRETKILKKSCLYVCA